MSKNIREDDRYKFILEQSYQYLIRGLDDYISMAEIALGRAISKNEIDDKNLVIIGRLYDVARAMSYDIFRYAFFHDIKCTDQSEHLNICETVYAAYAIKWIATLHPLSFDIFADGAISVNVPDEIIDTKNKKELEDFYKKRILQLCNEYYAVCVATLILTPSIDSIEVTSILDDMSTEEVDTFLYSLRYRLKHQDVYTPILKRIHSIMIKKYQENKTI